MHVPWNHAWVFPEAAAEAEVSRVASEIARQVGALHVPMKRDSVLLRRRMRVGVACLRHRYRSLLQDLLLHLAPEDIDHVVAPHHEPELPLPLGFIQLVVLDPRDEVPVDELRRRGVSRLHLVLLLNVPEVQRLFL